ncbi:helix-turn-helix transcriptional regulator [Shewanella psychropiezotolerans]|uniref:Helix-turn-helix transcriptional regulator n=1 Tax=Shewanella psychropiezotolerans TaxID=2593655 RepID=A0ABX5WV98_9GAMM|nr:MULTISPECIES: helix-turn-helix transcriptional regulator [Shewanella]MPY25041.1 helix-turn-helix transcriptional regulator [Shewanella sp. YLB-07]QDO82292.1 helix-turn-helix transcriptional regulator [Shewanella psychropiezotolerans]
MNKKLANEQISASSTSQVIAKTIHMPANFVDDWHTHIWHQIIFPVTGLLQSDIGKSSFIVPHNAILFVPANTPHKSVAVTQTRFLSLYLNPSHSAMGQNMKFLNEPKSCLVTPFLKELILLLIQGDKATQTEEMTAHLLLVLNDQLVLANSYQIPLLIPDDRRLKTIFSQLKQQPDLQLTLSDWARRVGASERTLSRLCAKEFNQSFSLWRQNVRLVLALQLLESKQSINSIALDLGYQSDSAFIHAFKGLFNQTPTQYRKEYRKNALA